MKTDLIQELEYIVTCAKRAVQQEKGEMETLGSWYINQQLDEITRAVDKSRIIHNGRQFHMKFGGGN